MDEKIFDDWKNNSEAKEETNFLFIRSLKTKDSDHVDHIASKLHKEAFEKISCLECGHCCKTAKPQLDNEDVEEIANFLKLSTQDVRDKYLALDEEHEWTFNSLPCPFLDSGNVCKIYDSRPKVCKGFPHTNKPGFASRSHLFSYTPTICPATYWIVENMKKYF